MKTLWSVLESKLGFSPIPSPQQKNIWDSMSLSAGTAKSIMFTAFNKSIVTDFEHKWGWAISALQEIGVSLSFSTMHSMGLRAVTATYGKVKIESNRVEDIALSLLPQFHDIWDLRRKRPGLLPLVKEIVGLCKMNLLDGTPEECYQLVAHHAMNPGEDGSILPDAVDLVARVLEKCADVEHDRCIDFDDMIYIPVKNKLSVKKYDMLLYDEFQDANRCQQALAKKAGHRLILIGDSRQAIYGFCGADTESMKRMKEELSGDLCNDNGVPIPGKRGCVVLPLTVTRRCGKAIVEEARKIVPDFEAHESNGAGKILVMRLENKGQPALAPPYRDYAQDGDMVLCRLNAPLVSETFRFLKAGRKANIQGRDVGQGLVSTIKATKAETITDLIHGLGKWISDQTAKEQAKKHPSEDKLLALNDRYDCLMCFIENQTTVAGVLERISSIFTDSKESTGIRLSSIHRAKGLESRRVFIIETEKVRQVIKREKSQGGWHYEQAQNLQYVAITRGIEEVIFVS